MDIIIYRRHSADCQHKTERYAPRCGCPLWFQFNWKRAATLFEGKKLKSGQNKWSAGTRSRSEAETNAMKLKKALGDLQEGKVVSKSVEVRTAVEEWWEFRAKNSLKNVKAEYLGNKLIDWCDNNGVLLLTALSPARVMRFRTSLPFRTGDSSSLSVHWSIIGGFFKWAEGMGYIEKNPIPSPQLNPQFAIRYNKKEVVPPSKEQVQKVIATATGRDKLLILLMNETAMALVDAQKFDPATLQDTTLIRSNRTKTGERFRVRIPKSLSDQLKALGSPAFPGTESKWRADLYKVFRQAGVKMTPHGFRHFRISQWLAQGIPVADVSKWVGSSEKEIRKTYEHWIKEAEDHLDQVQRRAWTAQGLDEDGNEVVQ